MRRLLVGAVLAALVAAPDVAARTPTLVFASDRTGTWQTYALHDGALAQLTFAAHASTQPVPSPDGGWVVFVRDGRFWRMRPDGTAQRQLRAVGSDASWLPDSRRFLYVDPLQGVRIGRVDGSLVFGRTAPPAASHPQWSHGLLLLQRGDELVVRARGRERTLLRDVVSASWSPSGTWIAVVGEDASLRLMRPDGRAEMTLATGSRGPASAAPAWSADGRRLAYVDAAGIHVVDVTSRKTVRVSATPAVDLAWAGERIAFVPYGQPGLRSVDARGGAVTTLYDGGPLDRDARDPAWTTPPRGLRLSFRAPEPVAEPVELTPRELRTIGPIGRLDANGDRVAFTACTSSPAVGVWRPGATRLGPPATGRYSCRTGPSVGPRVFQTAVFGDRVAYVWKEGGIQVRFGLVVVDAAGSERTVAAGTTCCSGDPQLPPVGFLHASGNTLVFSTWERGGTNRPPVAQTTWRVRDGATPGRCPGSTDTLAHWTAPVGGPCELLATVSARYEPLAFDGSRLVVRSDRTFVVDPAGAVIATVAVADAVAAAFVGRDVVIVSRGALHVVDAVTGIVMRTWSLPNVDGGYCGVLYCSTSRLALAGAAGGVAAYVADRRVHLLRLADGADVDVAAATAAQLTPAGLFYAYSGPPPYVGRIAFVPYAELPLR